MTTASDRSRRTGPALEKAYQFILWLIPTVEQFPRGQRFLLGDRIQTTALDAMDHFVKERLRAPGYVRYVDDFALFHDDPAVLAGWRDALARHLEGRRLRLHPRKTMILRTAEAAEFLGLMLAPGGHRSLPADAVSRFRRKLRSMRDRFRNRAIDEAEVRKRVGGWIAHAEHADTWRLRQNLFRGGWFDPAREPDQPDQARGAWWFLEQ